MQSQLLVWYDHARDRDEEKREMPTEKLCMPCTMLIYSVSVISVCCN